MDLSGMMLSRKNFGGCCCRTRQGVKRSDIPFIRNSVPFIKGDMKEKAAEPSKRADAQRNLDSLLQAAKAVFAQSGVDAPVRDIAEKAGVGVGTVYRHFPQRSDLIVAVFQQEVDACADAAPALAEKFPPGEALAQWLYRFLDFIAAKRGLAT